MIPEIGAVPSYFGTTPWGLVLGNLFYPGFISVSDKSFFIALHFVVMLLIAFTLMKKLNGSENFRLAIVAIVLFSPTFWTSLYRGNCSGLLYGLLVLLIFWHNQFPILSGIALGFAMIKPQSAGLICLALLLQRKFKPVIVAAALDILAWVLAAVLTATSPIGLLQDFFAINIGIGNFCGIFTVFLMPFPENLSIALSMLAGIAFTVAFHFRMKNKKGQLAAFFPACVATTFWSYSFCYDRFLLCVPVILSLVFLFSAEKVRLQIFWLVATVVFQIGGNFFDMHEPVLEIIHSILQFFIPTQRIPTWWISTTIHEFMLIVLSVVILLTLNRHEENNPRI